MSTNLLCPRTTEHGGGLTTGGAVLLTVLLTGAGAGFDALVWGALGWVFAICFWLASGWVAARIRRQDLAAAVGVPPLVFAAMGLLADQLLSGPTVGPGLVGAAVDLATTLAIGAPILLIGTALAAGVALARRSRTRRQV